LTSRCKGWIIATLKLLGAGLPTPPKRPTEGLLWGGPGQGDLRSEEWHGRETGHNMLAAFTT